MRWLRMVWALVGWLFQALLKSEFFLRIAGLWPVHPAPTLSPSLSGSLQGRKSLALGWDLKLLSEEAPWVQSVWWGTNGMGVAEGGANHD